MKSSTWIHRPGKGWKQLNQYHQALGDVLLLQGVSLTKTQPLSALNLALGRDPISGQPWLVATNEPATLQTFREYALRFAIEEEFLDEKSNGFQLERSEVRSLIALSRLCFVLAVATLVLTDCLGNKSSPVVNVDGWIVIGNEAAAIYALAGVGSRECFIKPGVYSLPLP